MLRPLELHRPSTVADAADLMGELGEDATLYAGGTELLLLMKEGLLRVRHLVDIKRIAGLGAIGADGETLEIGATATYRTVERSSLIRERCPLVAGGAQHVANVRVRNVGTVGGNLTFADPQSDPATLLLALDAVVRLASPHGAREVPLGEFVRGPYETVRERHEVLTSIRLRPWPPGTPATYLKFGVHERPMLGIALALMLDGRRGDVVGARLAVGCVGPRPERLTEVEERFCGRSLADLPGEIDEIAALASRTVATVPDLHGTAEYKRELVRVFVRRAFRVAAARARGHSTNERYPYTVVV